jgi:RNA polymerase sigma-70 factor (family 1)
MHLLRDPFGFEAIFHSYKGRVYSYVLAIVKSGENAEEVTQEVFIKLWLCREMLEQVDNLDAFVFVIARNKALDHLRKAAYDVRLLNALKGYQSEGVSDVDELMTAKDYQVMVAQAVRALSPQRKKVYELSRVEGLNHEEIADRLKLSRNTVKNHLVEALRLIRQHLYKTGGITGLLAFYMAPELFCEYIKSVLHF